MAKCIYK